MLVTCGNEYCHERSSMLWSSGSGESPHGFDAEHWDHATCCRMPNDKCQMTKEIQSPNIEGRSGVHWPGWSFGFRYSFGFRHSSFGFGNWFMESPVSFFRMHWDLEPFRIPLNRPAGTFSPTGGEGWDEGVRFMESPVGLTTVHWDHEPQAVTRPPESADKSDALQTLRAVRRRSAVAKRLECVRL